MKKLSIQYGLILGGVALVWGFILLYLGVHDKEGFEFQIVPIIASIAVTIFALLEFRKNTQGLILSEAIKISIIVNVISTIIWLAYYFILINYIDPGMVDRQIESALEAFIAENPEVSDEVIDRFRQGQEFFRKPILSIAIAFFFSLLGGLLYGLVGGAILKKKRPD